MLPVEVVATPATSPEMDVGRQLQKITGGIERDFALLGLGETEPENSEPERAANASVARGLWLRGVSISLLAPLRGGGLQDEFLHAPLR